MLAHPRETVPFTWDGELQRSESVSSGRDQHAGGAYQVRRALYSCSRPAISRHRSE
jgi:hypothetical protein